MTAKSDALLRDFATLFVKYRAADWEPLLGHLSNPTTLANLANAIRHGIAAADAAPKRKSQTKARRTRTSAKKPRVEPELVPRFSGPNAEAIEQLRTEFLERKLLAKMMGLRALWVAFGLKTEIPKRREAVIAALTQHLDTLEAPAFEAALAMLMREQKRENPEDQLHFQRWFDLITDRGRS